MQWQPWKALLMIDARTYFDDSGTHKAATVTVIGGYAGLKEEWESIEGPWRAVLNEFSDRGLHSFHATSCLSQADQFERLEKWECHYVYKQLSDILERSTIQPITAAVRTDDWASITDRNFHLVYQSAYDFCIDRIIGQVVNWSSNHAGGSRVPVMIAMQKEHEKETRRTYDSWSRVKIIEDRIGALAFEYPDRFIPLQAADMIAHELYRIAVAVNAMENRLPQQPEQLHPPVLEKIISGRRLADGGLYDRWFLEQAVLGISPAESA
jgi:hypothetical protein